MPTVWNSIFAIEPSTEFAEAAELLRLFSLTPYRFSGNQVTLTVAFNGHAYPASRELCKSFNLQYGDTVGASIRLLKPEHSRFANDFRELYATAGRALEFVELAAQK